MTNKNRKKILLVEDEIITARVTSNTFERNGFHVITAPSGEIALETIDINPDVELVLMDIDLGSGIDGTETARRLLDRHNVPVVFHTSHSEKEMVDSVKGITRYGYVLKNSGEFVLIEAINMALDLFYAYSLAQNNRMELEAANEELQTTISELEVTNEQLIESQNEILEHEKKLQESERHYRQYFDQSFDGIYRIDIVPSVPINLPKDVVINWINQNSYLIDANPAFAAMYGLTPETMIGRPVKILSPDYAARAVELLYNAEYRVRNIETFDYDIHRNKLWILESFYGEVIDGKLRHIWGSQKNITEQKKTESAIRDALKERNDLLRELHHRVKNSFSMISSIIMLEEERQRSEEFRHVLNIINSRIHSIASLYSLLRDDISTDKIRFDHYCSAIINSLAKSYVHENEQIETVTDIEPVTLTLKQAMPAGLILTEIITNSLKYAFPSGNDKRISFKLKNRLSEVTMEIRDNGIGLPADFDTSINSGLGLELVVELVKQINGRYELSGKEGVHFVLTIPSEQTSQ